MDLGKLKNPSLRSLLFLYTAAGLLIYSRVIIEGGFVFDDFEYVVGNQIIQDMSALLSNFSDPRQLGYFSFALNYLIDGENPFGYHLVNVVIHILNGIVVFFVAEKLMRFCGISEEGGGERGILFWMPASIGLLFIVHPLQTQAVSYVTQRFTSMAALFYLSAICFYFEARQRVSVGHADVRAWIIYLSAFLCAAASMKVKEISFTLPAMIFILDLLFFRNSKDRAVFPYFVAPFIATMAIIPLSIFGPDWGLIDSGVGVAETTRQEKIFDLMERPVSEYFMTQLRVLVIYMRLLFFPYHQSVVYDVVPSRTLFDFGVLSALFFHFGLVIAGIFSWIRAERASSDEAPFFRIIPLGLLWFYVTASIESSFIPIKDLIFEHRAYLPGFGLMLTVLSAGYLILRRLMAGRAEGERWMVVTVLTLSLVLGGISFVRNTAWINELNLWDDVVEKRPDRAIGYNNRGNVLSRMGRFDLALQDVNKTIEFFEPHIGKQSTWEISDYTPGNMSKTYITRSSIHAALGNIEFANADAETAKRILMMPPIDLEGARSAAEVFYRNGNYAGAINELDRVLDMFPNDINSICNRGNAYVLIGNYGSAIADFSQAIKMIPTWPVPYHDRGVAYQKSGDRKRAAEDFQKACELGLPQACEKVGK